MIERPCKGHLWLRVGFALLRRVKKVKPLHRYNGSHCNVRRSLLYGFCHPASNNPESIRIKSRNISAPTSADLLLITIHQSPLTFFCFAARARSFLPLRSKTARGELRLRGSENVRIAPPPRLLLAEIHPLWSSTIRLQIESPSPVP